MYRVVQAKNHLTGMYYTTVRELPIGRTGEIESYLDIELTKEVIAWLDADIEDHQRVRHPNAIVHSRLEKLLKIRSNYR